MLKLLDLYEFDVLREMKQMLLQFQNLITLAIDVTIHNPNDDEQLMHPVERIASNGDIDK